MALLYNANIINNVGVVKAEWESYAQELKENSADIVTGSKKRIPYVARGRPPHESPSQQEQSKERAVPTAAELPEELLRLLEVSSAHYNSVVDEKKKRQSEEKKRQASAKAAEAAKKVAAAVRREPL